MLGKYLKKKFGSKDKDVPVTEQFYTPLRIALHSTIELQTIDMLILDTVLHPAFNLPQGSLEVLAVGKFDMDGVPIHQVYARDESGTEYILQLVEGKDYRTQEPTLDEATLYQQIVSLQPETRASLDRYLGELGFMTIEVDGIEYNRIWGDAFTEKADFRMYREKVVTPAGKEEFTNEWLLYGREIDHPVGGGKVTELLIVGMEEGGGMGQILMQVGLKLNTSDIKVL